MHSSSKNKKQYTNVVTKSPIWKKDLLNHISDSKNTAPPFHLLIGSWQDDVLLATNDFLSVWIPTGLWEVKHTWRSLIADSFLSYFAVIISNPHFRNQLNVITCCLTHCASLTPLKSNFLPLKRGTADLQRVHQWRSVRGTCLYSQVRCRKYLHYPSFLCINTLLTTLLIWLLEKFLCRLYGPDLIAHRATCAPGP